MARIMRVVKPTGLLFMGALVSGGMYEEVVAHTAKKYDPFLMPIRLQDMLTLVRTYPFLSLVRRRTLEVNVVVRRVSGRGVRVWMAFDIHGRMSDVESLLWRLIERFAPDSDLGVESGSMVGEVFLPEEPYCVPTPHNGEMYFLKSEKEMALAYLAQNFFTVPR